MRLISVSLRRLLFAAAVPVLALSTLAAHAAEKNTVVYIAGSDVVVKSSVTDLTYSYVVPPSTKLPGGVAIAGLKPGDVIDGPMPGNGRAVDDASVVSVKVVGLDPSGSVNVDTGEDKKKIEFPTGMVKKGGAEVPVSSLKPGDTVEVTLLSVRADGDNRPMNAVKAPALKGTLAKYMQPNLEAPDSASNLPFYGLLGGLLLTVGAVLKLRKPAAVK